MNYGNMNNGLADRLHDILDTKLETNYGVVICGVNSEQLHALVEESEIKEGDFQ